MTKVRVFSHFHKRLHKCVEKQFMY